jgi:hypothetical protein
VAHELLEDQYRRHPTQATYLGVHKYDDRLEDYSKQAVSDEAATLKKFRGRVAAIDAAALSPANQLDREQVLHAIDSSLLGLEVVRQWATNPDSYSSGLTNSAYLMIKREFAPPEQRLRELTAREKLMPAAPAEARRNLEAPPRIYTEIAIQQADGNRGFFKDVVPGAFAGSQGPGAPRRLQGGQRCRRRGPRRLQEMAADRPPQAIHGRVRVR